MTLYIKQKLFSLKDEYTVYDLEERPVYTAQGKFFSIGAKIEMFNERGETVMFINQKLMTLLPTYEISAGGEVFAVMKQKLSFLKKKIEVESTHGAFKIDGNFWDHEYTISHNGTLFGTVSKEWLAWGDVYALEINNDEYAEFFVAMVLAIDNILSIDDNAAVN